MRLFEQVLVPLLLAETLGAVNGRTRFQKLVFLVQRCIEKAGQEGLEFDFSIYLHGPYSQDLRLRIDELVRNRYLDEMVEQTPPKYEMHVYRLTNKGRELLRVAKTKKLVSVETARAVRDVVERYGDLSLPQLVNEAYKQF